MGDWKGMIRMCRKLFSIMNKYAADLLLRPIKILVFIPSLLYILVNVVISGGFWIFNRT